MRIRLRRLVSEDGEAVAHEVRACARDRESPECEWIGDAEPADACETLDRWVVETTLAAIAQRRIGSTSTDRFSFVLSRSCLLDEGFLDFVVECFDRHEIDPDRLGFEVPGAALQDGSGCLQRSIGVLHAIGVRFGVRLDSKILDAREARMFLAFDYLRVCATDPQGRAIEAGGTGVRSLIDRARAIGVPVVRD